VGGEGRDLDVTTQLLLNNLPMFERRRGVEVLTKYNKHNPKFSILVDLTIHVPITFLTVSKKQYSNILKALTTTLTLKVVRAIQKLTKYLPRSPT